MSKKQVTLSTEEFALLERLLVAEGGRQIIAQKKYHQAERHELADMCDRITNQCVVVLAKIRVGA